MKNSEKNFHQGMVAFNRENSFAIIVKFFNIII